MCDHDAGTLEEMFMLTSISCLAAECTPRGSPDLPSRISSYAIDLANRFGRLGSVDDLDNAISSLNRAIDLIPEDHPDMLGYVSKLGFFFMRRFQQRGELADLDRAVSAQTRAVEFAPEGHPERPGHLCNLADPLTLRFEQLGEVADLDRAISLQQCALDLAPEGHPDRHGHLINLGNSFGRRFRRFGDLNDLNNAISAQMRAVELTPEGHPARHLHLGNLAVSLDNRFARLGELTDLEGSISAQRSAINTMPPNYPHEPMRLSNLGGSLSHRFDRLGELTDLDDAIAALLRAVELTPDGHPEKPAFLNKLGNSFTRRFERLGERSDLDNGVSAHSRTIQLAPDGHPDKPRFLSNLGGTLSRRFQRSGEHADIDNAIAAERRAVSITPDDHPRKWEYLNNLGVSLSHRFQSLGKLSDIDEAILAQRNIIKITPDDHLDKPSRLSNLGNSLSMRFERFGALTDIKEAIAAFYLAISLLPSGDYPNKYRINLAAAWRAWLHYSQNRLCFRISYNSFMAVARSSLDPPESKVRAAVNVVALCNEFPNLVESEAMTLQAHRQVLESIPPFIWLGQSISHRYEQLSRYELGSKIVAAASAALVANKPALALEWLEEGRSIVWGQLDRLRSPFDALRRYHPSLADELECVSASLQGAGSRVNRTGPLGLAPALGITDEPTRSQSLAKLEEEAREHRRLAKEYEDLLARVRQLEGFTSFLRPKTLAELTPASRHGPVAVINVDRSRCDAIVLCSSGHVVHVPLPDFSLDSAEKMHARLFSSIVGRAAARHSDDRGIRIPHAGSDSNSLGGILKLLWLRVVQPILCSIESEVRWVVIILCGYS
jgi:tetratricopeptide (TPR) repeat protein